MMNKRIKKRVLIIEDEFAIADLLSYSLAKEGYEVRTADNGEWGLQLLGRIWGYDFEGDTRTVGFKDKQKLMEILNRWKYGDFSQIVEDHNFVWSALGGTVEGL